jgi:hypothetical protein
MIMVDEEVDNKTEEKFGYTNQSGVVEYVLVIKDFEDIVSLRDEFNSELADIYIEDIPKMIKALQAAYNFAKEDK